MRVSNLEISRRLVGNLLYTYACYYAYNDGDINTKLVCTLLLYIYTIICWTQFYNSLINYN